MNEYLATPDRLERAYKRAIRPPPKLSLSEWADEKYYMSAETSAQPGKWKTLPHQKGIMDAITDPRVTFVSLMKSARIGYTLMFSAAIGYYIDQDPSSMLVVQPTVDDAKNFSKEQIQSMLREIPALSAIIFEDSDDKGTKDSSMTITHKKFPGGVLSLVGANSGTGFRRISRRVIMFDEVDAYPPSAGSEGDPIKLGTKRAQAFWNRKIIAGSTPLIAGQSRIEALFEEGDQRRYYVPCPQCDHMDFLAFRESESGGHWMTWPKDKPEEAHFVCSRNGCVIEHKDKRAMVARGEWRAAAPFHGHASFHIWAAYSFSPNDTWADIAKEFLKAKKNVETLKTFVNTTLGETWKEVGEAPDWERLHARREKYQIGTVPKGVLFLTSGVDVQKDRLIWEVVGWGHGRESWSVDCGVIPGDTTTEAPWKELDELLERMFPVAEGGEMRIAKMAVDSGFNTQRVYNWARRHVGRVIATKGMSSVKTILGSPTAVDIKINGKRIARGAKVWPVGVDIAKSDLYGWLRQPAPEADQPFPSGWCHFPEYGPDYFKQLTAEHLVSSVTRTGFTKLEWQLQPGRENHYLDARIYARAAAALLGLDRMVKRTPKAEKPREEQRVKEPEPKETPPPKQAPKERKGWLTGKSGIGRGKGWLKR